MLLLVRVLQGVLQVGDCLRLVRHLRLVLLFDVTVLEHTVGWLKEGGEEFLWKGRGCSERGGAMVEREGL